MFRSVGRKLSTPTGVEVEMPHEVAEILDCGEWAIVRLEVPEDARLNQNILAINSDGSLRFRLPDVSWGDGDHPYLSMGLEGTMLHAYSFNGVLIKVDYSSGEVLYKELAK